MKIEEFVAQFFEEPSPVRLRYRAGELTVILEKKTFTIRSQWVGWFKSFLKAGENVTEGQVLGQIIVASSEEPKVVLAPSKGKILEILPFSKKEEKRGYPVECGEVLFEIKPLAL